MITDLIVTCCLGFCIWRGAIRGFIQSLIGPLTFLLATAFAYVYYSVTKNIPTALCIGILGPFVLYWISVFILRSFGFLSAEKQKIVPLSRGGGAVVTCIWGMSMILPIILILSILPPALPYFNIITKDIHQSWTNKIIKPWTPTAFKQNSPPIKSQTTPVTIESLSQDKRIQNILSDPNIIKAIEAKDFVTLMANPKILEIAQDPELVQKMMTLYSKMAAENNLK